MITTAIGGRNAEAHRRSMAGMARLAMQPERIAERAAAHRANAEAHMEFVAMGREFHRELAMREYQLAYDEESVTW